jgi:hypothetical protein
VSFIWFSEQAEIMFIYRINCLIFITEAECVYCAVRAESSKIIEVNLRFYRMQVIPAWFSSRR